MTTVSNSVMKRTLTRCWKIAYSLVSTEMSAFLKRTPIRDSTHLLTSAHPHLQLSTYYHNTVLEVIRYPEKLLYDHADHLPRISTRPERRSA